MKNKNSDQLNWLLVVALCMLFSGLGLIAQPIIVPVDTTFNNAQDFSNFVEDEDVIFEGNVTINAGVTTDTIFGACIGFKQQLIIAEPVAFTLDATNIYFNLPLGSAITGSVTFTGGGVFFEVDEACGTSLPVEIVDFVYDYHRQAFLLQVTDEYDIEQYRIVVTDQDNNDIGYKWWYAYTTDAGLYRIYEIPMELPDCAEIEYMYAYIDKMEKSTMQYEKATNTIVILNN
jgi:hypothetical protein